MTPLDKAKVEQGVLLVERWILAALRHRQLFSLAELNEAIRELVRKLNQKPFHKLPGTAPSCTRNSRSGWWSSMSCMGRNAGREPIGRSSGDTSER